MEAYVERAGLAEPWEAAPSLVDLGYTPSDLADLSEALGKDKLAGALDTFAAYSTADQLEAALIPPPH